MERPRLDGKNKLYHEVCRTWYTAPMSSFDDSEPQVVEHEQVHVEEPGLAASHVAHEVTQEAWGQAARGTALFALLGMAIAVTVRLLLGRGWSYEFLSKNEIAMSDRLMLIAQMTVAGGLFASVPVVCVLIQRTRRTFSPEVIEKWAWFLSPLILLPAPLVIMTHELWTERHKDLLPIIVFGGILAEFFFSKSLTHIPPQASRLWAYLWETSSKRALIERVPSKSQMLLRWFDGKGALLTVVLAALAYGVFMSFFTVRWHHKLGTAIFDLGINNNILYGGLHGHFNESSVLFPDDPAKYLANHVKWGIYAFLPIYALIPRAETLLVIQSVSLGLGAIPLYLFCKDRVPPWWAAAIALCYLAYYPLHGANFYEMKLVPTAAAVVLLSVWLIDTKRYIVGGIFFFWAMIMREDMPVPLAMIGGVFLLSGRRPYAGLIMTVVATSWFIFLRFRFMNDVGSWWFPNMYKDLWAAPERGFQGVVKTLLSNPAFTLKHIFVEKKFWYLMHLLAPLMFIPVRRWYGWAALLPGAVLTLLVTDYAPPLMFSFQYVMHWAPYLFLAAAVVLASYLSLPGGRARAQAMLVAMCLVTLGLSYNYGAFAMREKSFQSGYHRISFEFDDEERQRYHDLQALLKTIPASATLGATEHVGAHLSSRDRFFTLRRSSHDVTYIVARKKELSLDKTRRTLYTALTSEGYGVEGRFGEFAVLKKGAPADKNDDLIAEWGLKRGNTPKRRGRSSAEQPSDQDGAETGDAEDHENDDQAEIDDGDDLADPPSE